jgi:PST family polysaccharide transporter
MPILFGQNAGLRAILVKSRIRYVVSHKTTVTAFYLYAIHFLNYLLPAVNVALLTRKLSASCYGLLIIAQSLGYTVGTITEFGFRWTGARAVAASVVGPSLAPLVSSINATKLLIAAACSALIPVYLLCIHSLSGHVTLVAGGYIWGVMQGFDLQWYFLGQERLRGYVAVDTLSRALATFLIVLLIRRDGDVAKVLPIQAVCTLGLLMWGMRQVTVEVGFAKPTRKGITEAMRDGGTLFLQNLARWATGNVNVAVLGMVASPAQVGYFGSADKLVRYLSSLNVPITQIVYPKITRNMASARGVAANRLAAQAGAITVLMAVAISTVIFVMPRTIIQVLYGAKMQPAWSTLRVLAIFPVLNAFATSFVYYWLLPRRMERTSLRVLAVAGFVNIVTVACLGGIWKQRGAATAVILTEALTVILYLLAMRSIRAKENRRVETVVLAKEAG